MTEDTLSENTEESDTGNVGDELSLDWAMPSDFPPEHVFMYCRTQMDFEVLLRQFSYGFDFFQLSK